MDEHAHDHDAHYIVSAPTTGLDFALTEEQRLLQEAVGHLAEEELSPLSREIDERDVFPRRQLESLANLGATGLVVPHLYGGLTGLAGMGSITIAFILAVVEMAKACATTAMALVAHTVGTMAVVNGGEVGLRASYLPDLARGSRIASWATGSGVSARRTGESYELSGATSRVPACGQADVYVVAARDEASLLLYFLLDKSTPGISFLEPEPYLGLRGLSLGGLSLERCQIPSYCLLSSVASAYLEDQIGAWASLGTTAAAVGLAGAAIHSCRHALERRGKADNYANYILGRIETETTAARYMLYRAALAWDKSPLSHCPEITEACSFSTEAALRATGEAIAILGPEGGSRRLPLERYHRDAHSLALGLTLPLDETGPLLFQALERGGHRH